MEKTFGFYLRKERERSGLIMKDVTDKMGWSVAYLSDIERDRRNPPSNDDLMKIAMILKSDYGELLNLANEKRGKVELSLSGKSESVKNLALSLSRSWDGLSDLDADRITELLSKKRGLRNGKSSGKS